MFLNSFANLVKMETFSILFSILIMSHFFKNTIISKLFLRQFAKILPQRRTNPSHSETNEMDVRPLGAVLLYSVLYSDINLLDLYMQVLSFSLSQFVNKLLIG